MAKRGRKPNKLNDQKAAVIKEQFLAPNPDGHPVQLDEPLVVTATIPEMNKVVFVNGRDPGCPLEFHYHSKTHYLKQYKLLHGQEYQLPVEVIDHLEGRSVPNYAYRKGLDGNPEMYVSSYSYLYQCRNVRSTQANRPAA